MRHFYFTLFAVIFFSAAFAQTNRVVTNKGKWRQSSTWSLGHTPRNGEVVEVPKNYTLVVDENINLTTINLDIQVYGKIDLVVGKLDLSHNSKVTIFKGGIIHTTKNNNSDKIQIGDVLKYSGSQGDITGPLVASRLTSIAPNGFLSAEPTILPVKWASFSAAQATGGVLVQWATAEEAGAAYYQVQRSTNSVDWSTIATVNAVGNSTQVNKYAYTDKAINSTTVYYRIRQVDVDGKASFTTVQILNGKALAQVAVVATGNGIAVQFPQGIKGKVALQVVALSGQVVASQVVNAPTGQVALATAAPLKGTYMVWVSNGQDVQLGKKVSL